MNSHHTEASPTPLASVLSALARLGKAEPSEVIAPCRTASLGEAELPQSYPTLVRGGSITPGINSLPVRQSCLRIRFVAEPLHRHRGTFSKRYFRFHSEQSAHFGVIGYAARNVLIALAVDFLLRHEADF